MAGVQYHDTVRLVHGCGVLTVQERPHVGRAVSTPWLRNSPGYPGGNIDMTERTLPRG